MMTATTLLIAILAAYRMGRMVAEEEGPGGVFTTLRGRFDPDQATWVGRGLNCPLCTSFWAALVVVVGLGLLGSANIWAMPLDWMAVAGGAAGLIKWEKKR